MSKFKLTSREKDAAYRFKREVCERAVIVDPDGVLDWKSLANGFFLAIGLQPLEAHELARRLEAEKYWS